MAFEDFRRDFQLSPLIWVIEAAEDVSAVNRVASSLREFAAGRGDLILSTAELASYQLPKLWVPVVFVHVELKSSVSAQPPMLLPDHALRVLVAADDGQLTAEEDPSCAWDMCVALGARTDLWRIGDGDGYAGWFGCGDPSTLLTALDVRARSHHEALIEQEIARWSSQPARRKVSFVICGCKRPDLVVKAVRSVAFQTMSQAEYEVIVVNNDVTDRTLTDRIAEARAAWFPEHPGSLRYVDDPIKGLSSARNAGIAEAEGEVISFLDDDAIAPSTFAEQIWCELEHHPEIGLLGGHIRLTAPTPAPDALRPGLEPYWGHYQTTYDKLTIVEQWYDFPWGSNWSARRLALLHIGGFRTRYGRLGANFGGGEEIVAAALIQSIGYQIAVSPDSEVLHAPESGRFTWEHVKRTITAGTLSQYMMELDGYIPASPGLLWAIREAVKPTIPPTLRKGRVGRTLRAYRRVAFIRLARERWRHRQARRAVGLQVIEASCCAQPDGSFRGDDAVQAHQGAGGSLADQAV
jgi:GT2 family glycosyltransferase